MDKVRFYQIMKDCRLEEERKPFEKEQGLYILSWVLLGLAGVLTLISFFFTNVLVGGGALGGTLVGLLTPLFIEERKEESDV